MTRFSTIFLLFILLLSACKRKSSSDDYSSATNLYVEYISAYTQGFIPATSDIRIQLSKDVEGAVPGAELTEKVFRFSPSIRGKAYWEDSRTVVFKPDEKLEDGSEYRASFMLAKLLETPDDRREFKFIFQCIPQNFEVTILGMRLYSTSDLERLKILGRIQTTDELSEDQLKKLIRASQDGKDLDINYALNVADKTHDFSIEQVVRRDKAGSVKISWDGAPADIDKKGQTNFRVPSLKEYTVTSVDLVSSGENYISVVFSDPLDVDQNMRGFVRLSQGKAPTVVAELNELKIYPTSTMAGEVTLTIDKALKNSAGHPLQEDFSTVIQFSQHKPEVKIVANQGVVMPKSEGLLVPFEAVNLRAVDVQIIRVYENNILQYLQTNRLGSDYELTKVAKPEFRKTIPLNTFGVLNLNNWNRFTIDLSKFITVEPGAIYQVRISFRKSQSLYFCQGDPDDRELPALDEDWDNVEESSNWDNWENDYGYYYSWENRDNPCHVAYYSRRRMVKKMVFASDLGLIAKRADQGSVTAFVTDLSSTQPRSGVNIKIYDYQQQVIGEGVTDGEGKSVVDVEGAPFFMVASTGDQYGYLRIDDGTSLSLSNFNVSGSVAQKGLKGYIYGERGVWRPGDTLHLSFLLEDQKERLPEGHPVVMQLYNPSGQLISRQVQTASTKDLYTFQVKTDRDAPTGNWRATMKVGGASFSKRLKIESIKPNRLKIELKFFDERLLPGSNQSAKLSARWLHGALARNLKAEYDVVLAPTKTTFKGFENVNFDDPSKRYKGEPEEVFNGRLNNEGTVNMNFRLESDDAPGMMNAIFRGKVFEEGGDFSVDKTVIPFVPYTSFVGVQKPEGDKRGMLLTDKDHKVKIVTVDSEGRPIGRRNLEATLYKATWRWWWDNSYNNWNYSRQFFKEEIGTELVSTNSSGEGYYTLRVNYPDWGRYFLQVRDPVSGHSVGQIIYIDWPGWAGKGKRGELGGATMLDFSLENEEVNVGDKVQMNIPSSEGGRILVSLETGSKILETFWVPTQAGKTSVEFEATADMSPNVYANVSLIQPHAQTANDLPLRMYGVQYLKVNDPSTLLEPVVSMPAELEPEQRFEVEVSEKNSNPMAYTVAIVDEGLLDLTKFKTPDPHAVFFAREALGIKTWDIFDDVIGSYGGAVERLLAMGGDEEGKSLEEKEANRFKPVVMFKGPFYLEPGETASHTFTMPQYVGSVRTMVVAGHRERYGKTEVTTPVRQPLMVLATLPRVAGPGEEFALPVNLFAMDKSITSADVEVSVSGKLKLAEGARKSISFGGEDSKVTFFRLKADESIGKGTVTVTATSGSTRAVYTVELQVRPSNPMINEVTDLILQGKERKDIAYQPLGLLGTNEAVVEVSSLPPLNLEERLKYLIRYPHGCIEQTTSSVFAQLYLPDLMDLDPDRQQDIQRNINDAIDRLRTFKTSNGALSYWPGNSQPSYWGTNYAYHFLLEAKQKGYLVPDDLLRSIGKFQRKEANQWSKGQYNDYMTQAYRMYTLSLAETPAFSAMNRLKANMGSLPLRSRWMLALSYATAGQDDAANEIIAGISKDIPEYRELGRTYGSNQRDQAVILQTLVTMGNEAESFEMIRTLAERMSAKRWMSTQSIAWTLISVSRFAEKFPLGENISVSAEIKGNSFRVDGEKYLSQVTIIEPDQNGNLSLTNNGDNSLFVRIIRSGIPLVGEEVSFQKNLDMRVTYMDMKGNVLDPASLIQGTDFMAEVTMTHPGIRDGYEEMALTQIFPSGWEIINTRLDEVDGYYDADKPEYQDIRDDRVLTYFDLPKGKTVKYRVLLNASYQGRFYLPAVSTEAMYDDGISALDAGKWVTVRPGN